MNLNPRLDRICLLLVNLALLFFLFSCSKEEEEPQGPQLYITYEEDFSDNSGNWPTHSSGNIISEVKDGYYIIDYSPSNPNSWYRVYKNKDLTGTYYLEAQIILLEGDEKFYYGLEYFTKDTYNQYFYFLKNNNFMVSFLYNYNYHIECDWTVSGSIRPKGEPNLLKLYVDGNHVDYYINDELVFQLDADHKVGWEFGFDLIGPGKIAIDYIKVYRYV